MPTMISGEAYVRWRWCITAVVAALIWSPARAQFLEIPSGHDREPPEMRSLPCNALCRAWLGKFAPIEPDVRHEYAPAFPLVIGPRFLRPQRQARLYPTVRRRLTRPRFAQVSTSVAMLPPSRVAALPVFDEPTTGGMDVTGTAEAGPSIAATLDPTGTGSVDSRPAVRDNFRTVDLSGPSGLPAVLSGGLYRSAFRPQELEALPVEGMACYVKMNRALNTMRKELLTSSNLDFQTYLLMLRTIDDSDEIRQVRRDFGTFVSDLLPCPSTAPGSIASYH